MLDRKSKKVLKAALESQNRLHIIERSETLLPRLPKKYTLDLVDSALYHLQEVGLLTCHPAGGTICQIDVSYEAQNYAEFQWMAFKSFLLKSIFTPIVVAAITTLITLWLKQAL